MKRHRAMTPEQCAARLTAFLNRKPRSAKTRAYLATLPKRRKVVVSPDEFRAPEPKFIARDRNGAEIARFMPKAPRKDRVRPRARAAVASPWACRPTGVRHVWGTKANRPLRSQEECNRQRRLLYEAQEGCCGLCGNALALPDPTKGSLDHVIPFALGGKDGLGNLLLAHGECNGRKSNDAPTGCEMVWLLAVNARLGVMPQKF